jgi:nucleotide-binding universal stress UspA family protein
VEVRTVSLIMAAVDGSEQSRRALMWALRYAAGRDATVQAVMAVNTKNVDEAERLVRLAQAESTLTGMVAGAVDGCVRPRAVTHEVVEGDASVVLVDATYRAELIVFGSHRMSSIRNPALSTVSLACIRLGACPVLVIPAGAPEPSPCGDLVPI